MSAITGVVLVLGVPIFRGAFPGNQTDEPDDAITEPSQELYQLRNLYVGDACDF